MASVYDFLLLLASIVFKIYLHCTLKWTQQQSIFKLPSGWVSMLGCSRWTGQTNTSIISFRSGVSFIVTTAYIIS